MNMFLAFLDVAQKGSKSLKVEVKSWKLQVPNVEILGVNNADQENILIDLNLLIGKDMKWTKRKFLHPQN